MVGAELGSAVVGQQREEQRAEHTVLWGTCISAVVLEVLWPTRTDRGLPVKKSRIQLQRELLRPSRLNLLMSCCGIIVLNAELKSMNSILTYESLFSRWVRARWRVEEIASSVERFGRYANWSGSSVLGRLVLMLCMTSQSTSL